MWESGKVKKVNITFHSKNNSSQPKMFNTHIPLPYHRHLIFRFWISPSSDINIAFSSFFPRHRIYPNYIWQCDPNFMSSTPLLRRHPYDIEWEGFPHAAKRFQHSKMKFLWIQDAHDSRQARECELNGKFTRYLKWKWAYSTRVNFGL